MRIPSDVQEIMKTLKHNGFVAYLVGGCVRDFFLGRTIHDFDIISDALAEQLAGIFPRVIPIGKRFGTVTLLTQYRSVEVSTMIGTLEQNCSQRDFTINSMAMDEEGVLYDYYGGKRDAELRILRAVGNADDRFKEDPLRLMRLIRFATVLEFNIDKGTKQKAIINAPLISKVSVERIRDEFCKIILSDNPGSGIMLLAQHNLLPVVMPELEECIGFEQHSPHHDKDVFQHTVAVLNNSPARLSVRLAALLHDIGKPQTFTIGKDGRGHFYDHQKAGSEMVRHILTRLKFDNKTIAVVTVLVKEHMSRFEFLREKSVKKFINRVGVENLDDLFALQIADIKGSARSDDFSMVTDLRSKVDEVLNKGEPMTVKELAINGVDLIRMGIKPGPAIGKMLKQVLDLVMEEPSLNTREKLTILVGKLKGESLQ
ncbi:CCA tRNA nucleotidyltransferase [Desulfofalx alkaliphila]|uniref:CCA tRNA nucleotidyltransferase n=1 Tax=Desulfofalx alkaliphila TaxID=105483 RepID=UPI0004E0AF84|nr:HD domain-containing protein [Desulfofalx alkaliphila]